MADSQIAGKVRPITARYVILGNLVITSACHLGGKTGETIDMELIRDKVNDSPLLTGASIAGALRNYLADFIQGYAPYSSKRVQDPEEVINLFGSSEDSDQSPLIVFDSWAKLPEELTTEIRDGVAINRETGTAEEHAKFDYEILPAGTIFRLRFDLLIPSKRPLQNRGF